LQAKFGAKGRKVVEDNLRIVRRGFDEVREVPHGPVNITESREAKPRENLPIMLKHMPEGGGDLADTHRFWEQVGSFYAGGKGSDNIADPQQALSLMPAATGVFRDMTNIRFEYPKWIAENCTACGDCYTLCPDSAIPGLVNSVSEVFDTAIKRVELERGMPSGNRG